jgi:hypothetical protein
MTRAGRLLTLRPWGAVVINRTWIGGDKALLACAMQANGEAEWAWLISN